MIYLQFYIAVIWMLSDCTSVPSCNKTLISLSQCHRLANELPGPHGGVIS